MGFWGLGRSEGSRGLLRSVGLALVLVLFAIALPSGAVGAAGSIDQVTIPSIGSDVTVTGGKVFVPMAIRPAATSWTGTLSVVFYFRQGSTTTQGSYSADLVYADVYQRTLDVAYAVPSGFGPNGIRVGSGSTYSYNPTTGVISVYVYLDEKSAEPPIVPPGGGGGGGGAGTKDVGVDSGHAVVDPTGNECTFFLDPAKTDSIFSGAPSTGAVLVDIGQVLSKVDFTPKNVTASIPAGVASQAGAASVPSVMNMGLAGLTLSPEVCATLATDLAAAAGNLGNLEITVASATGDEAASILSEATPSNMVTFVTPASGVITISFAAVHPTTGRRTPLAVDAASVQISFDPSLVTNPGHVGLFRIGSLIYVGGKVDTSKNTVSGTLSELQEGEFIALEYSRTFDDLAGHWAKADVELMASKFVVDGMTATTFGPDSTITRAQFVTMLVRSLGLSEYKPAAATFSDVASGAWYYGYVEAAFQAGLATGDGGKGSTFRPEAPISREEMAALMIRAMKTYGASAKAMTPTEADDLLKAFADNVSISRWARVEAAQAYVEGIIQGRDGGKYAPVGNGTRAEGATMMKRYMKKIGIL